MNMPLTLMADTHYTRHIKPLIEKDQELVAAEALVNRLRAQLADAEANRANILNRLACREFYK